MNKKKVVWLSVVSGMLAMSVGSMAVSSAVNAVEASTLPSKTSAVAEPADASVQLAQAETASGTAATYSAEQSDRGEAAFEKECVECHGDDLRGGLLGGPPLRGVSFEDKYAHGSPANTLFEVMSYTMPPNAPGRLSAATYADIMAYILKRNGFAAGAPLPDNADVLGELVIEK